MVFPIVLGSGKRLFDGAPVTMLKLTGIKALGDTGVTIQTYVPA